MNRLNVLLVALLTLGLAACAGPSAPSPSMPATSATPAAAYPISLTDDEGTSITIDAAPQRIVSLTPATTEIVFALGAGDRLVGRGEYDDYPPESAVLPAVATFTGVAHEALVGLEPDLVLAGGNNFTSAADIKRMRDLGMTVMVVYAATLDGVLFDIELIGAAIDARAEAATMTTALRQRVEAIDAAVAGLPRPRTFYQIGSEPEIYGPAPESFIADMVVLAGGEPITTTDPAAFAIAVERLVAEDPEVIVLGDAQWGVCPADVAARPGWESMTAVQQSQIRPVFDTIVTRPGPRIAEGLAALALAIHPDAPIEPPADLPELCPGEGQ